MEQDPPQQQPEATPSEPTPAQLLEEQIQAEIARRIAESETELSKNQKKNIDKKVRQEFKKRAREEQLRKQKEEQERLRLERARNVHIEEDPSLPTAVRSKIRMLKDHLDQRVKVYGWVQNIRWQGNKLLFLVIRDGSGYVQTVLNGQLCQTIDALNLHREATVCVYGVARADERAEGGVEIGADYWELIGESPAEIEERVNEASNVEQMFDQRHIVIRRRKAGAILRLRAEIIKFFRQFFEKEHIIEVTCPTLVQTQVEGGATLFGFNYYGENAFLTQSSQLYLETVLPALGDCFTMMPSYRAEKSRTRRHLAEFTHLEAELAFITFDDLLNFLERMIVDVIRTLLERCGDEVRELNPDLVVPETPFLRMDYSDAIKWLQEHGFQNEEEGRPFQLGDDIPEAPERRMTDMIGRPILMCRFPAHMKAFYMSRCPEDNELTESVDVLLPGVGEIVGGSMRCSSYNELMSQFQRHNIDPAPYFWYLDQRKFGTTPHGGFGVGIERFVQSLLKQDHIRNACLYPRYMGRCTP
eukprot:gnl/Trimastix_PCT/415.p1 GENE.gnl/Trimastix_PCT/415~~gnl/Trimastix_PCT/415.p1  ORF type:complete len:529 (+),score=203.42 gnl/Trimastix_PCT/415:79-1665(+)